MGQQRGWAGQEEPGSRGAKARGGVGWGGGAEGTGRGSGKCCPERRSHRGELPRRPPQPHSRRASPAAPHLGLKSWKRPLRFMAENFAAAASSSPLPPRRAACALQRVHGASASRVPAAATAAAVTTSVAVTTFVAAAAARRNLSPRPPPLLPGFRTAAAHAPSPAPSAGEVPRASLVRRCPHNWRHAAPGSCGGRGGCERRGARARRLGPVLRERSAPPGKVFAGARHLSPRCLREISPETRGGAGGVAATGTRCALAILPQASRVLSVTPKSASQLPSQDPDQHMATCCWAVPHSGYPVPQSSFLPTAFSSWAALSVGSRPIHGGMPRWGSGSHPPIC